MSINTQQVFLSDLDLAKRYGVHRTTVWRWVKDQGFPPPERLSAACTRWVGSEVAEWERTRAEHRIRPRTGRGGD